MFNGFYKLLYYLYNIILYCQVKNIPTVIAKWSKVILDSFVSSSVFKGYTVSISHVNGLLQINVCTCVCLLHTQIKLGFLLT